MNKYILGFVFIVQCGVLNAYNDTTSLSSNKIVLPLDDSSRIIIYLEKNLEDVDDNTDASFYIFHEGTTRFLGNTEIVFATLGLRDSLTPSLTSVFDLHKSITDIGYSYNEWVQNDFNIGEEEFNGRINVWVGLKHMIFWGNPEFFMGWIYTQNGNICLELTLAYTGSLISPFTGKYHQAEDHHVKYDDWMKENYRTVFFKVLSKEIAKQWLEIAKDILEIIKYNNQKQFRNV